MTANGAVRVLISLLDYDVGTRRWPRARSKDTKSITWPIEAHHEVHEVVRRPPSTHRVECDDARNVNVRIVDVALVRQLQGITK